ncbi:hypothetical protein GCM10010360_31340 [Streptomyces nogalater]
MREERERGVEELVPSLLDAQAAVCGGGRLGHGGQPNRRREGAMRRSRAPGAHMRRARAPREGLPDLRQET